MVSDASAPGQSQSGCASASESCLREAVRLVPALIGCLDAEGRILLVNEGWARTLGCSEAELRGRSWSDFVSPSSRQEMASRLRAALASSTPVSFEASMVTAGGQQRLVSWHCSPLTDETTGTRELLCIGRDVTEQRFAESAGRESQRILSTLLSNLPGMAYRCALDPNWTMHFVSEGCLSLTGYPPESLLYNRDLSYNDLIVPEDRDQVWNTVVAQVQAGEPYEMVYRIRTAAGAIRWVWEKGRGIRNPDGTVVALEGFIQDITEAHTFRERLCQILDQMPIPLEAFDADGNALMVNPAFCDLVGLDGPEQVVGRHNILKEPILREMGLQEQIARVFAGETISDLEVRIPLDAIADRYGTSRRGEVLAQATFFPVLDAEGSVQQVVTIWKDVTEERRALEALRLRDLALASATSAIFIVEDGGRITYVNRAAEKLFGYPRDDFAQVRFADLWAPGPGADALRDAVASRQPWRGEVRAIRRNDGSFEAGVTLSWASENAMLAIVNDITQRKRASDALRESERRLRQMTDLLPDAVLEFDRDYIITYANQAAIRFLNQLDRATGVGLSVFKGAPPDAADQLRQILEQIAVTGEPLETGYLFERPGQPPLRAEMRISRVTDVDGACIGWMEVIRDVSEQERTAQAQRLSAIGHLAAGVAHEFNNLLAAMSGRAQLAQALGTPEAYKALVDTVLTASERGAKICRNLTDFARPRKPQVQPVYLHRTLDAAVSMAAREIENRGILVKRDYRDTDHPALADGAQMEQVMLNLILNACQAMPEGGTLTLTTHFVPDEEGGQVVATIRDTGVGIRPEDLPHIYEPFFTTRGPKSDGSAGGSGLGLSVSHGIVAAHGGSLTAHSTPGQGATFEVRLRAYPSDALPAAATTGRVRMGIAPGEGRHIVVAEDEADVREVICCALQDAGYRVTAAGNADEAVAALQRDEVHAVVSDLVMPGGGGRRVLKAAANLPTPVPVLLITGMPPEPLLEEELRLAGARAYLAKPFGLDDLARALNRILSTPSE